MLFIFYFEFKFNSNKLGEDNRLRKDLDIRW